MSNLNLQKLREWVWPWPWAFNSSTTVVSNTVVIQYVCMTEVGSSSNTAERKDKLCTSKTTKETESRLNSFDLNKYFNFAFK